MIFGKPSIPSMDFIKDGTPIFKRFQRDSLGRTKRIHAYVTLGSKCNGKCKFCRNQCFDSSIMEDDHENLSQTLRKFSPYIHTIIFGGGEPLLYADELSDILYDYHTLSDNVNSYIVTNGTRKLFLEEVESCRLCRKLSGVLLSRHHYDDTVNGEIFGNSKLLTENDIRHELCNGLKNKMEFLTTCIKGGIDSADEIVEFANWGLRVGIEKFLFNDLQRDVTNLSYWEENQIGDNVFSDCEKRLLKYGFRLDMSVCYTAGYDVVTYIKGDIRIGFKRYHKSKQETMKKWNKSKRFTYDLSIMPNGEIFTDWTNRNKI